MNQIKILKSSQEIQPARCLGSHTQPVSHCHLGLSLEVALLMGQPCMWQNWPTAMVNSSLITTTRNQVWHFINTTAFKRQLQWTYWCCFDSCAICGVWNAACKWSNVSSTRWSVVASYSVWQTGPDLSRGIRWCLALASVRPQWCLLWRFYVCAWVCAVWMVVRTLCVMEAWLINVICVNCGIWNLGIYQLLHISGACNVCPSSVLWLDPSPTLVMSVSKWGC